MILISQRIYPYFSDRIVAIGNDDEIAKQYQGVAIDRSLDASGCCILPGEKNPNFTCQSRSHNHRILIQVLLMLIHIRSGQVIVSMSTQKK